MLYISSYCNKKHIQPNIKIISDHDFCLRSYGKHGSSRAVCPRTVNVKKVKTELLSKSPKNGCTFIETGLRASKKI